MDIIERVILSDALATIPTEHLKSNQPHSLAPTQPMRYAREPDVITAAPRTTTRIRLFGGVIQVVGDYASLMLRWMGLGLGRNSSRRNLKIGSVINPMRILICMTALNIYVENSIAKPL